MTSFFSFLKRATVLKAHIGGKLKRLRDTRWVERHDGVLQFVLTLPSIVETLDEVSEWTDKTSAGKAAILSRALSDSQFIVGLFCLSDVLACTLPLSFLLQKESTIVEMDETIQYIINRFSSLLDGNRILETLK